MGCGRPPPGSARLHPRGKDRVVAEYSGKLGAYDEEVPFDDTTADALMSAATALSATLKSQAASRSSRAEAMFVQSVEAVFAFVSNTSA